jgi:hypothetical protein
MEPPPAVKVSRKWTAYRRGRLPQANGGVSLGSDRGRLQAVLLEIAGEGGRINPRRLGRWIERMASRPCAQLKIERGRLYSAPP